MMVFILGSSTFLAYHHFSGFVGPPKVYAPGRVVSCRQYCLCSRGCVWARDWGVRHRVKGLRLRAYCLGLDI